MEASVDERDLHVHHRVAGEDAREHGALDTLIHAGNVFLRDRAAGDGADELVSLAGIGLDLEFDMGELALAAGLAHIAGVRRRRLLDGLLVRDLGLAHVCLHLELAEQTVHDDLQVKLSHARDDRLARLLVRVGLEGGILLAELREGDGHFLLAGLGLGLDGHTDDRLGKFHGFEHQGVLVVGERIAGAGVFQPHHGGDLAGVHRVDIFAVIGVHVQQPAKPLALSASEVHGGLTGLDAAGVDSHEREPSHEGIGHDLEHQRGERTVDVGGKSDLLVLFGVHSGDRRNIQRRGEIIHHGVEQLLHALVFIRGPADDRDHFAGHRGLADHGAELVGGDLLPFQIHLGDLVVKQRDGVDKLFPILPGQLHFLFGDGPYAHVLAQVIIEDDGVHIHQIHDAAEIRFLADGQLDGHRVRLQAVIDHVQDIEEIRAGDVHFVDIDHSRHVVVVRLPPDRLGLGLHAALGAEDRHTAVQHAQAALHLGGEVHVARSIDDIDAGILPEAGGGGTGDGDAALLFLHHPVHGGVSFVHLAELVVDAGVEKDPLRGRGFSGIDVGHDADISGIFE